MFHASGACAYDSMKQLRNDCVLVFMDETTLTSEQRPRLAQCKNYVSGRLAAAGFRPIEEGIPAEVHPDCAPYFRRAMSLLERSGGDREVLLALYEKEHGPVRIALPAEQGHAKLGCPGARIANPELRLVPIARPYWDGSRGMPSCGDYRHLLPPLLRSLVRFVDAEKRSTLPRTAVEVTTYVDSYLAQHIKAWFPNCTR